MKRTIKIEDILFPDGSIENYEVKNDELRVTFNDYCGSRILMCFRGDLVVKRQEDIEASVYESHFSVADGRAKLRLLDDDLKEIVSIEFAAYTIVLL